MNSLFQQLNQQQNQISQGSLPARNNDMLQKILNSSNPNELLNTMISSNPKMQQVMKLMQSSGMSPKQFFYQYAQQNGINPDDFLRKEFNNG